MATGKKTGGRVPGSVNKLNAVAKDNIAAVFVRLGGTAAMAEWAEENKTQFYQIYAKLLPLQVAGDSENPLTVHQIIMRPMTKE